MTFVFKPDEAPNQYQIGRRFYGMKFRIRPGVQSALQDNSEFMTKIEANDLILPPSTPNLIILFFQTVDFTVVDKEEGAEEVTSLLYLLVHM